MEQGHQNAARAGAEIDDFQRCLAVGKQLERRLDQGLGIRPGHEGFRGEPEGQAPELPLADDPGHRLMGETALGEGGEGRRPALGSGGCQAK